jgi:hypothetical protein
MNSGASFRFAVGRLSAVCALGIGLVACVQPREPPPAAPATEASASIGTTPPIPYTTPHTTPPTGASSPAASLAAPGAAPRPPATARPVPPGALYVCVSDSGGAPRQTAIAYEGKTDALCRKHPEMGPCQYERNACRHGGGRVYAADGTEITWATEAEYDRKVRRAQFRSN